MKFNFNINLPQKSIFGFRVLSSLQSSLFCYVFLFIGKFLNPLFGLRQIEIIAGSLFNIVLNISIVILVLNLIDKRKEIKKNYFIFLNSMLFLYLPIAFYDVVKYVEILFFFIFKHSNQSNTWSQFLFRSLSEVRSYARYFFSVYDISAQTVYL